jgi:hypothetical protein
MEQILALEWASLILKDVSSVLLAGKEQCNIFKVLFTKRTHTTCIMNGITYHVSETDGAVVDKFPNPR